jgi:membrane-associated phospholipid phosphatase
MKTFINAVAVGLFALPCVGHADIVTDWNAATLNAIRSNSTAPPAAARNLAMVHIAIHDAVNGLTSRKPRYAVVGNADPGASPEAAAATAGHDILVALYPNGRSQMDALYNSMLAQIPDGPKKAAGRSWGAAAAAQLLVVRANDGATAVGTWPGSEAPGQWRPTASFGGVVRPALASLWGQVTPFALHSGSQFRPPLPPPLNSGRYALDVNQVKRIGAIDSVKRTVDQTEAALFWSYGPGSSTPPGHWNQIAQVTALKSGDSLGKNARVFALLNIALADAGVTAWDCKYEFNLWRPITAIALADTDGNPFTSADPAWTPLLATPPFPEYVSGHSTFSAAGAVVLTHFYGPRTGFSLSSDDMVGVFRNYNSFWHAAHESGLSRIYGGIHFASANVNGLALGAAVGAYVLTHSLRQ